MSSIPVQDQDVFDQRWWPAGERSKRRRWVVTSGLLVLAVCAVSFTQRALLFEWPGLSRMAADSFRDLVAATLWIPLGAAVVRLSGRFPLRRDTAFRVLPLHLAGAGVTALTLNLVAFAIFAATGTLPPGDHGWLSFAWRYTVGLIHLNALLYALILGVVSMRQSRPVRPAATSTEPPPIRRIAVPQPRGTALLEAETIDWVEAAGDYVRIHARGRSWLVQERMHCLERRLDPQRFARVHRSAIVNLERVREVQPRPAGEATLVLVDETRVPLSRRRRPAILERLKS